MTDKLENRREFLLNNENLYSNVAYLAWPAIIQSLLHVSIGTIDIKMVGSLGVDAISGFLSYFVFKRGHWQHVKIEEAVN